MPIKTDPLATIELQHRVTRNIIGLWGFLLLAVLAEGPARFVFFLLSGVSCAAALIQQAGVAKELNRAMEAKNQDAPR